MPTLKFIEYMYKKFIGGTSVTVFVACKWGQSGHASPPSPLPPPFLSLTLPPSLSLPPLPPSISLSLPPLPPSLSLSPLPLFLPPPSLSLSLPL